MGFLVQTKFIGKRSRHQRRRMERMMVQYGTVAISKSIRNLSNIGSEVIIISDEFLISSGAKGARSISDYSTSNYYSKCKKSEEYYNSILDEEVLLE